MCVVWVVPFQLDGGGFAGMPGNDERITQGWGGVEAVRLKGGFMRVVEGRWK